MPTRRQFLGTAAITAALAGCGGANDGNGTTTPGDNGGDTTTGGGQAAVQIRSHDTHGDILVDSEGVTLYMFVPDADTDGSACYDACANAWPPLTVEGDPTAGDGVTASLSTITREGGEKQVVAGDWPLYYYASDANPGDAKGQGVNDAWYVLGPDGTPKGMDTGTTEPPTTEPATTTEPSMGAATVQVRTHDTHGDILVDSEGMTLYMFDNDTKGADESTCTGGCASAWPPLTVDDDPTAGEGVSAPLSTFEREGGETQVAADGWPLYYYASDASPGDASGQGASGVWYVLRPDGTPLRDGEDSDGY